MFYIIGKIGPFYYVSGCVMFRRLFETREAAANAVSLAMDIEVALYEAHNNRPLRDLHVTNSVQGGTLAATSAEDGTALGRAGVRSSRR